ncbi:hypothetical protein [Agarivorans sp.]|uniref:hypothetical protein n=1 Tax=Agarivorans sp. TaxID=1872412 RepID=UPI003CFCBC54
MGLLSSRFAANNLTLVGLWMLLCPQLAAQQLEIEIGAFFSDTSTDISAYENYGNHKFDLNFESELNLPADKTLPYINLEYHVKPNHLIYSDWRRLHREGLQQALSRPFSLKIDGQTYQFQAGARLETRLDVDIIRVGYGYRFYHSSSLDAYFLSGFHITKLGLGFAGEIGIATSEQPPYANENVFSAVTAPLPNVGFEVNHRLSDRLALKSHAHAFYLKVNDITGWMAELEIGAKYRLVDELNITGSFSYYQIGVDYQTEHTELDVIYRFWGPMLKLSYAF